MSDLSFIGQQIPEEEEGEAVLAVISGYHPQAGGTAAHRIQLEVVGEGVHFTLWFYMTKIGFSYYQLIIGGRRA